MAITASMVKELREMTGAGMMDCKKALAETDGNMEAALDVLRKSGAAKMEKKASRIAAEGICRVASEDGKAVVAEVNSETDFVAKNEIFRAFVQDVADKALKADVMGGPNGEDVQTLLDAGLSDEIAEKTLTIGEKLSFRRFEKVTADCVATYLHAGGKIGVLVASEGTNDDAVKEALTNVAMQVAAMRPEYVSRSEISDAEIAKRREITIDAAINDPFSLPKPILQKLLQKAVNEKIWSDADIAQYEEHKSNMNYLPNFLSEAAKPQLAEIGMGMKDMIVSDKIFMGLVEGRIGKQLKEISLMDQVYVKAEDGKQTVKQYLDAVAKADSAKINVTKFVRFETGEGLEKRNDDFAAEVAAAVAK